MYLVDSTSCTMRHCNKCDMYRKELQKYKDTDLAPEQITLLKMEYDNVISIRERAQHCLHCCGEKGKKNCFECENQVALEEIIELCDEIEDNWFN